MDHEIVESATLCGRDAYTLLTSLISPRPIAWVSTHAADGRRNLAPFSFFQGVCSRPPTIMLGIASRPDGSPKDTLRNILDRQEFTVSCVAQSLAAAMNATSAEVAADVDEWTLLPAAVRQATAVVRVGPPRVAAAPASLECRMTAAIPVGQGPQGGASATLVMGEVVCFTAEPGLLARDERGHFRPIDPARLAAVGRMGGIAYTRTTDRFELPRPPRPKSEPRG